MTDHQVNEKRRTLIKSGLAAGAAMSIGIPVTSLQAAQAGKAEEGIRWHKGVCRFCGTGCGLQVGVRDGRIVATKGDPEAPSTAGSTASRATSTPRSCTAGTASRSRSCAAQTAGSTRTESSSPSPGTRPLTRWPGSSSASTLKKAPRASRSWVRASTPFPKPTQPPSSGRAAFVRTTSIRTPACAWRPPSSGFIRPSASTSPPTTTATSNSPTR